MRVILRLTFLIFWLGAERVSWVMRQSSQWATTRTGFCGQLQSLQGGNHREFSVLLHYVCGKRGQLGLLI
jgi:hypothetical protein